MLLANVKKTHTFRNYIVKSLKSNLPRAGNFICLFDMELVLSLAVSIERPECGRNP